ncbi:MAG: phage scaffolding protein [Oscillospiraceae bacterium]|nr:phage scaffolding protein [Oscillospiraceae bacterium]
MKKLLEILKANGIEIPEEKQADVKKAFFESYKSVGEYNKAVAKLTEARDSLQSRLETAETTLQAFEGMDAEKVKAELSEWKKKAEDAETKFNAQITARDQQDWLKAKLEEYGVTSPYARKQLMAECMDEKSGLKWKGGDTGFYGFDDFMKDAKKADPSLYQSAEEKAASEKEAQEAAKTAEAAKNAPKFTSPAAQPASGGKSAPPPPIIF